MNLEIIRGFEHSLLQEDRGAVRNHAIPFHFTETEATVPRSALGRLPGKHHQRPLRPRMDLVIHHVLETLIETGTHEDTRGQLFSSVAAIQNFIRMRLQATLILEDIGDPLCRHGLVERRGISEKAELASQTTEQRFHELRNRHSTRNAVLNSTTLCYEIVSFRNTNIIYRGIMTGLRAQETHGIRGDIDRIPCYRILAKQVYASVGLCPLWGR